MYKFLLLLFIATFSLPSNAQDNTTLAQDVGNCDNLLIKADKIKEPLLSLFPDLETAEKTNKCFNEIIKQKSTEQQFDYYLKAYDNLEKVLQGMLFYKADDTKQKIALYEFLYRFQAFCYFKLTSDKEFDFENPYSLNPTQPYTGYARKQLEQEVLKISNIQGRRQECYELIQTTKYMTGFFATITNNRKIKDLYYFEFKNLIYQFVMILSKDEYFMNALNSKQFIRDWFNWETMMGHRITDETTVPVPYPIPFP